MGAEMICSSLVSACLPAISADPSSLVSAQRTAAAMHHCSEVQPNYMLWFNASNIN